MGLGTAFKERLYRFIIDDNENQVFSWHCSTETTFANIPHLLRILSSLHLSKFSVVMSYFYQRLSSWPTLFGGRDAQKHGLLYFNVFSRPFNCPYLAHQCFLSTFDHFRKNNQKLCEAGLQTTASGMQLKSSRKYLLSNVAKQSIFAPWALISRSH
jgi:hypothetical protein